MGLEQWIVVLVRPDSPDLYVGPSYFPTGDLSKAFVFAVQQQARQIAVEVLTVLSSYSPVHALIVDLNAYSLLARRVGRPLIGWEGAEALVREEGGGPYNCVLVNPKLEPAGDALGCSEGSSSSEDLESRP